MAPVARKIRASKRFAEYEEKPVKEFDIENEIPDNDGASGSDDESVDENAGTEHYVAVGKSKLRQKEIPTLGPEYRGARVSRAALDQSDDDDEEEDDEEDEEEDDDESGEEEYDDPELADLEADQLEDGEEDFEIDSDNALCESDEEKFKDYTFRASKKPREKKEKKEVNGNGRIKKRPTAADYMSSSDGEEEGEEEEEGFGSEDGFEGARLSEDDDEEEEGSEDDEEDEEDDDDDDDDDEEGDEKEPSTSKTHSDLKKALSQGQQTIISAMSAAAQADAKKGIAVRIQRHAFDNILHLRVRLQKALVAANTFPTIDTEGDAVPTKPYQAAEEAAVKLWNTIDSVRQNFLPARVGEKRKRTEIDLDTPSLQIWESMQDLEEAALSHRRAIINKWSDRVKKTSAGATKTRNLVQNDAQSLVSVLDSQLVSSERLVKRARTPRSCAPAQAARKVEEDPEIYDDADFYQLLLKELVDQRSADTGAPGESVTTVRWAALKETKVRKQVDRRASKGRKLRYTVHEKLQNFMAPEDRRSWEEHAIDRLFGTLFGQKLVLNEEEEQQASEDEEMGGVNVEEEGLKLFRS